MVLDNLDDIEDDLEDVTIEIGGRQVALEDVERAYGALAQAKDIVSVVTPGKVILATGLVLLLLAPPLAEVALLFGPAEYFGLAVFALGLHRARNDYFPSSSSGY